MAEILGGLVIALVMFIIGKVTSDMNSNRKYEELKVAFNEDRRVMDERHVKDKEMWAGMFKTLSEKMDAINDSLYQNNLILTGKVSIEKMESAMKELYTIVNELRDKVNGCPTCRSSK